MDVAKVGHLPSHPHPRKIAYRTSARINTHFLSRVNVRGEISGHGQRTQGYGLSVT